MALAENPDATVPQLSQLVGRSRVVVAFAWPSWKPKV
jgi:hypothetical protein